MDSIDNAIAEAGEQGEVRQVGAIPGNFQFLNKAIRRLRREGVTLHIVCEAGPRGYETYRHLFEYGLDCIVVVPSLVPKRAGELSPVYVPDLEDEAIRDLIRARTDTRQVQSRPRGQCSQWVVVAAARELPAFVWAFARQAQALA